MSEIAPSILAADFNRLGENIQCLEKEGVRILHVDVMDGCFVPSISFGMPLIESIRRESSMFFDVHLMIQEPVRYLEAFIKAGADGITIHAEACQDIQGTLEQLKAYSVKAALSIKPGTPVTFIEEYLDQLDMVLIMSVEPGFGGQEMIPSSLDKVRYLKKLREEKGYSYQIEIDGGINQETLKAAISSGVDIAVAGTAVFKGNIAENLQHLKEVINSAS